ncbi:MAG: PatA/PatG family cyanobactin maturation protease [Bacteroidota bacterium]
MKAAYRTIHEIVPALNWLWKETKGEPTISIAIIDGQVDTQHPALKRANLTRLGTNSGCTNSAKGASIQHGTHVTSIIFGQHDSGLKGIAPHCKGLLLPVYFNDKQGNITPCSQLDLAKAITTATLEGAHIINISGGEWNNSGEAHPLLKKAIEQCAKKKVLVVTAAGNDGCECLHIPGALPSVLTVGGMDARGAPLPFSNWGKAYRQHGLLAPAENIPGAIDQNQLTVRSGTSFATAIVSGIAALLLSIQKQHCCLPDPAAVKAALLEGADGCNDWQNTFCQRLLKGRINIKKTYSIIHSKNLCNMEKLQQNHSNVEITGPVPSRVDDQTVEKVEPSGINPELPPMHEMVQNNSLVKNEPSNGILPSCGGDKSCNCKNKPAVQSHQKVYALGSLGYDLGSSSRRESLSQQMGDKHPDNPLQLLAYLEKHPWEAASITWTLTLNSTPIYAIRPAGSFAAEGFKRLQQFLHDQINLKADRISVPGVIVGQTKLMSGQTVPIIHQELRGMYNWNIEALTNSIVGQPPAKGTDRSAYEQKSSAIENFLQRIYHELQNLGVAPQERAINYAATNALNVANIFTETLQDNMQLDTIEVEKSAVCRMGADCWDVLLTFFDPENQMTRARRVFRFTIDVSDVSPVMIGAVRSWSVR